MQVALPEPSGHVLIMYSTVDLAIMHNPSFWEAECVVTGASILSLFACKGIFASLSHA
jgi:hypothetical protein